MEEAEDKGEEEAVVVIIVIVIIMDQATVGLFHPLEEYVGPSILTVDTNVLFSYWAVY